MKLALVGPSHPYKGGIAQHTTALAHRLDAAGHEVHIWSWKRQYPAKLYPGEQRVPGSIPELPLFSATTEPLSWDRPLGWVAAGRRGRRERFDAVILTWTTPIQGPAYLGLLAGWRHAGPVIGMCHNVLPHEPRPGDPQLTRAVLRRCRGLLVHSDAQAAVARTVAPHAAIATAPLPPPPLSSTTATPRVPGVRRTLLFFGLVRPYKGLDLLLRALPAGVRLIVAGEFWTPVAEIASLVAELGLGDRVELRPGYVAAEALPALFAEADAVVLPYRSGTASIVTDVAHQNGVPAVVTRVGTLADSTVDGVDGLVVPPEDVPALTAALASLYDGSTLTRLQAGVRPPDADALWGDYVHALEDLLA